MSTTFYNNFLEQLQLGSINLETASIRVSILSSTYTPNADHVFRSETSGEISSGVLVTGADVTQDDTEDSSHFTHDNIIHASVTGEVRWALYYIDTGNSATDTLLFCYDLPILKPLDIPPTRVASGDTVTISAPIGGIYFLKNYGATGVDVQVKVSSNDSTAGYLNGKLIAGTGITFTEGNDGGDETLTIQSTASGAAWGGITGTLSNQTDLQTALDAKEANLTFSTGLTRTANTITNNLLTGISGGQTAIGGTASGNSLILQSTSHATKGSIRLGNTYYNEVNQRLGINNSTPYASLVVTGTSAATCRLGFAYSNTYGQTYFTADFSSGSQNSNILTGYINQIGGTGTQWIQVLGNQTVAFSNTVSTTARFTTGLGSISSCAVSPGTDSNTGTYYPGADQMTHVCGGNANITMTATSNAYGGVGVTSHAWNVSNFGLLSLSAGQLKAGSDGTAADPFFSWSSATGLGMYRVSGNILGFATAGTLRFIVDGTGQIGIGTGTTASAKHHVRATTEQQRLDYDSTHYFSTTVASTGSTTFALTGTTPVFIFGNEIQLTQTVTTESLTSDTSVTMVINGTTYKLLAKA